MPPPANKVAGSTAPAKAGQSFDAGADQIALMATTSKKVLLMRECLALPRWFPAHFLPDWGANRPLPTERQVCADVADNGPSSATARPYAELGDRGRARGRTNSELMVTLPRMTRRKFLELLAFGGLGLVLSSSPPVAAFRRARAFTVPLAIPPTARPVRRDAGRDFYVVVLKRGNPRILPGTRTPIWGFDGVFPGPTFRVRRGREIVVRRRNQLGVPTSTHLHGGKVPWTMAQMLVRARTVLHRRRGRRVATSVGRHKPAGSAAT